MSARGVLLLGLFATASVAQPLTTVALELSSLPEEDWQHLEVLSLEKRLVLRLVQDGFAVVASTANPEVRVRLSRGASGLQLSARSRSRDEVVEIPLGTGSTSELHLELVQRAAELARASTPPPVVVKELAPAPPPAAARPPPWSPGVRISGSLGFVTRAGGTDAAVRAGLRLGRRIGGELMIGLLPSGNAAATTMELPVLLGVSLQLELGLGFALEGALAGGVLVRAWFPSSGAAELQLDALGSLPITLAYFPLPWLGLGLRLAPSIASGVHGERGAWWFEATGLAFLRL